MIETITNNNDNRAFTQKVDLYLDRMSLNSEDRRDLKILLDTKVQNQKAVWLDIFKQNLSPKQARRLIEGLVK